MSPQERTYNFCRSYYITNAISVSNVLPYTGAIAFALNSLPNFAEFTALYDLYKIRRIKVEFLPKFDGVDMPVVAGTSNTSMMGYFFSVVDKDDSTMPADLNTLLQYQDVKRTPNSAPHARLFTPGVAAEYYQTTISTAYGRRVSPWISCANPSTQHYGLKVYTELPGSGTQYFDMQVTMWVSFKTVR